MRGRSMPSVSAFRWRLQLAIWPIDGHRAIGVHPSGPRSRSPSLGRAVPAFSSTYG